MSTVIEPNETEPPSGLLAVLEPLGRGGVMALFEWLDTISQWRDTGKRFSYDYEHSRLRLHGESENSGDKIKRTRALYFMLNLHTYLWMGALAYGLYGVGRLQSTSPTTGLLIASTLPVALAMVFGGKAAIDRTEIVDHTTEPVDDCDDLKQQYLNDELTEAELEAETEARLE